MFYEEDLDRTELRFGDVLRGFIITYPVVDRPVMDVGLDGYEYKIDISVPAYVAVMTPCCSIGREETICLSPLTTIKDSFLNNPHFQEDMTRINRIVKRPRDRIPTRAWEAKSPEEQAAFELTGENYTNLEYFVYDEHDSLPLYQVRDLEVRYRMVDFKRIHKVSCPNIKGSAEVLESKFLQLTDETRTELQKKIVNYYSRPSTEELALRL